VVGVLDRLVGPTVVWSFPFNLIYLVKTRQEHWRHPRRGLISYKVTKVDYNIIRVSAGGKYGETQFISIQGTYISFKQISVKQHTCSAVLYIF
jgi:hypothetical protein